MCDVTERQTNAKFKDAYVYIFTLYMYESYRIGTIASLIYDAVSELIQCTAEKSKVNAMISYILNNKIIIYIQQDNCSEIVNTIFKLGECSVLTDVLNINNNPWDLYYQGYKKIN